MQKPFAALMPLVKAFSAPGELVLDPFSGADSSLAAAKACGRVRLGIELDAAHHQTAMRRLL